MMRGGGGPSMQMQIPFTKTVKSLVIVNVAIWFVVQVLVEQLLLKSPVITEALALTPGKILESFFIWQPITYMFLHDVSPTHILFNMLVLWMIGSELESTWGSRF